MTAPKHLSDEAKRLWRKLVREYEIADAGGLLLVTTACEAFGRMREAQDLLAQDGLTVVSETTGSIKTHPAVAVERDSRTAMLSAIKQLNLDLEPILAVGRPPGGSRNAY